jgi:hypothetical protein
MYQVIFIYSHHENITDLTKVFAYIGTMSLLLMIMFKANKYIEGLLSSLVTVFREQFLPKKTI